MFTSPVFRSWPVAAVAAVLALAVAASHAESFASSAISNSVSASVGSVSTSFGASSESSSPGGGTQAGAWTVIDVAAAPGREGYTRLTLRALPGASEGAVAQGQAAEQLLFLPDATVAAASLAAGQVIHARARSYGLELAKVQPGEREATPFFLVVADAVYRELQTRVVRL